MSLPILLVACGERHVVPLEPVLPDPGPSTGTVVVSSVTSGDAPDPDGFEVALQVGGHLRTAGLGLNDSVRFTAVDTGMASVVLLGVAAPCQVSNGASQFLPVWPGTQRLTFRVDCSLPPQPPAISLVFVRGSEGIHRLDHPWISPVPVHPGEYPAVSPDGTRIAFRSGLGIAVMNADGTGFRQLTPATTAEPVPAWIWALLSPPSWAPDGTRLVYADVETGGLSTIGSDGSDLAALTTPPPADWICPGCSAYLDMRPEWSPDGSQIAFGRWEDLEFSTIWIMNADGSDAARLARRDDKGGTWAAWGPSWSPDGTRIAFAGVSADWNGTSIFVTDRMGSSATHVPHLPGLYVGGIDGWSPDGEWLVFAAGPAWDRAPPTDIYLTHTKTGTTVQLTHDGRSRSPAVLAPPPDTP